MVDVDLDSLLDEISVKAMFLSKKLVGPDCENLVLDLFINLIVLGNPHIDVDFRLATTRCKVSMTLIQIKHKSVYNIEHNRHVGKELRIVFRKGVRELNLD